MAGCYKCTNVKFNMNDARQKKAYEILQRAKGKYSYGVLISDALLKAYRQAQIPANLVEDDGTIIPNNYFVVDDKGLDHFADMMAERLLKTDHMKQLLGSIGELEDRIGEIDGYMQLGEALKMKPEATDADNRSIHDSSEEKQSQANASGEETDINDEPVSKGNVEISDAMLQFACG